MAEEGGRKPVRRRMEKQRERGVVRRRMKRTEGERKYLERNEGGEVVRRRNERKEGERQ
jgi:hypothetical protein